MNSTYDAENKAKFRMGTACQSTLCSILLTIWAFGFLVATSSAHTQPPAPNITEPVSDGLVLSASDVHMQIDPPSDPDGDDHLCSDFEIWSVSPQERVWYVSCIGGIEKVHVHLADGSFVGSHEGRNTLFDNTQYFLRVRYRDSSGDPATEWSPYSLRSFVTGSPPPPAPGGWSVASGFVLETVATNLQLPVNLAFVPNPSGTPGTPLLYVTELYGNIKVVLYGGQVQDYATNLLNFTPTGSFPGSGEQGVTGIIVDPANGDVIASMLYDSPGNPGTHYPKIVRFHSNDGGITAASQTVILDMPGEIQGESHQISNLSAGPDGKLYVHMGDGFNALVPQDLSSFRGKILRMNWDGSPVSNNPFYDASDGIDATDYIYAYGLRNPFGGAWRAFDNMHYEVEDGPYTDRFAKIIPGRNYLWSGTDTDMRNFALYNWAPAHGVVNIAFIQPQTFSGSLFPSSKMDHAFVSESGPTWASGKQDLGKRIVEFSLDANGNVVTGPTTLVEYNGNGKASVVGLAAGPDGLYFTDLYKDLNYSSPTDRGANIFRVRYVGSGSNVLPTVSMASPSNGASYISPANITLTANAQDTDGSVVKVEFFANSNLIGSVTNPSSSFTWNNVAPGTYTLTARATDNSGGSSLSSPITITVKSASGGAVVYQINSGGPAASPFAADSFFTGGSIGTTTSPINTSGITTPAPQAVYQSERYGNHTYAFPNLTPGGDYLVRLHLVEFYWSQAGQRVFNVSINGSQALNNFDILAAAGGKNIAIIKEFSTKADVNGVIQVDFSTVVNNAKSSGIEIISMTSGGSAPNVNISNPANGSTFSAPATIQIDSNVTGGTGGISKVEFYANGGFIGSDASSPYSFTWSNVEQGTYSLAAKVTDNAGATATSAPVNITVQGNSGGGAVVQQINSGDGAAAPFSADRLFNGGRTASTSASIDTSGVSSPAPQAVYQSERYGDYTYTIPNLVSGAAYLVRLHFAEFFWTQTGQRVFNVSINGSQVLANFDILAAAGGRNIAIVREFTATADASGNIQIVYTTVTDNAKSSGIEILTTTSGNSPPQVTLTNPLDSSVFSAPASINLQANASDSDGSISKVSFFANGNLIGTDTASPYAFIWNNVSAGSYSLTAQATDNQGAVTVSLPVNVTVGGSGSSTSYRVNSGGGAVSSFAADNYFTGGSTASTSSSINISGVTNPAPQAVYQTERYGNHSYNFQGLTPGGNYTVRLHFAEFFWTQTGRRVFNVSINGSQVLANFDILAVAGGANVAIVREFTATADASGNIQIVYTTVTDNAKSSGIEILPAASTSTAAYQINSGGGIAGSFAADNYFTGGSTASTSSSINISGVTNPAPQAVYQTERYGNHSYNFQGLTPGGNYTVRLHFAEFFWTQTGRRVFNVSINGSQVLTNFDILAAAGGANVAIVREFTVRANTSGNIQIVYTTVTDNAKSSGIEILP